MRIRSTRIVPFEPISSVCTYDPDAESDPTAVGVDPVDLHSVWVAMQDLYKTGVQPAMSLCIRRKGQIIFDRAIGHSHGNGPNEHGVSKVLATPQTPFCIFSASKAVTAMVIHLLDDRGLLHIDDRVADYIPEFAAHGKGWVTLRHVLIHRAGIPNLAGHTDAELLTRPDEIVALLCDAKPTNRAGRRVAYHAITGGFILAEVVRRVTGKDVRQVLDELILAPLGFEWMNYGAPGRHEQVATNYFTGRRPPWLVRRVARNALGVDFHRVPEISNDVRWHNAIVPSGNITATANELSRFYQLLLNDGELDGVRIFEGRTIRRARNETSFLELDVTLGVPLRYGLGFMLGERFVGPFGWDTPRAFGHVGFINCFGWADPERDIAVGFLTSGKPAFGRHLLPLVRILNGISGAINKI